MTEYDFGRTITISTSPPFTDEDGNPTNVTAPLIRVEDPLGVETVYSEGDLSHPSIGVYEVDVDLIVPGVWVVETRGTLGTITIVNTTSFRVRASRFEVPS